jgi:hypothetical protein
MYLLSLTWIHVPAIFPSWVKVISSFILPYAY